MPTACFVALPLCFVVAIVIAGGYQLTGTNGQMDRLWIVVIAAMISMVPLLLWSATTRAEHNRSLAVLCSEYGYEPVCEDDSAKRLFAPDQFVPTDRSFQWILHRTGPFKTSVAAYFDSYGSSGKGAIAGLEVQVETPRELRSLSLSNSKTAKKIESLFGDRPQADTPEWFGNSQVFCDHGVMSDLLRLENNDTVAKTLYSVGDLISNIHT